MSKNYDNWERLVVAVVRREADRQLAYTPSINTVSTTDLSSNSTARFDDEDDVGIWMSNNFNELCFPLEPKNGGKCHMVCARELMIVWGENSTYWKWTSSSNSRFGEVAKLVSVYWLDIRGTINTQMLSSNTNYGAYLVFKLTERSYGLEFVKAVVRLVNYEDISDAEKRAGLFHLQRTTGLNVQQTGRFPTNRMNIGDNGDETNIDNQWMELEMGSFYNDEGDDGEVEARLMETKNLGTKKSGLIVQGIEFRPI